MPTIFPSFSPSSKKARPFERVTIVGGGVIGLSIGWRLASAGLPVDLFERGKAGRGASWAAAGMLAAVSETEPSEEALLGLTRHSQSLWPRFTADLMEASNMGIGYRTDGTLMVALTRDDAEQLRFTYDLHLRLGLPVRWLSGRDALALEPHLNPRLVAGCFSAEDHQADNRLMADALIKAFLKAGGRLHEDTPVDAVEITAAGSQVSGVVAGGDFHGADCVVLAAGAWSRLAGLPKSATPPVRPIKGQMLSLQMNNEVPLIRHVVWATKAYLVPRDSGRLIIGATVEERGYDETMTAGGVLALLDGAWRALPGIEDLPIAEMWTGFRPGSPDDAPILGPCDVAGLVMACGHHRNGILLTPVTADCISTYILSGSVPAEIEPFGINRFNEPLGGQPEHA